jgi:hypothetical protein
MSRLKEYDIIINSELIIWQEAKFTVRAKSYKEALEKAKQVDNGELDEDIQYEYLYDTGDYTGKQEFIINNKLIESRD